MNRIHDIDKSIEFLKAELRRLQAEGGRSAYITYHTNWYEKLKEVRRKIEELERKKNELPTVFVLKSHDKEDLIIFDESGNQCRN